MKWNDNETDPLHTIKFIPHSDHDSETEILLKMKNSSFIVNPLHRIEFGPLKFFSKTFKFSIIFYSEGPKGFSVIHLSP